MRLQPDAYDKVKNLRREVPLISPAAVRVSAYPQEAMPPLDACKEPLNEKPCATRTEDVSFSCPHVEPGLPVCDPDKRGQ